MTPQKEFTLKNVICTVAHACIDDDKSTFPDAWENHCLQQYLKNELAYKSLEDFLCDWWEDGNIKLHTYTRSLSA